MRLGMLAAGILLAALPLAAAAQSPPPPPIASSTPLPTPSPSPSATPNSYLSVGFRASSITLPYGSASSPRGAFINFLLQFNANNALEVRYDGDSFGVNPVGANNRGFQTPPPPGPTSSGSPLPLPVNLGSSLNRLELRYFLIPHGLNFGIGAGFASFTNGSQLPQYPALSGLGIGGAILPTGTSPLFGSIFFYPSLAGSSGGTKANAITYRAGLHLVLPASSLFGELGFDGETLQTPSGGPSPSAFSYNTGSGGSQTRNAITLGLGIKF